MRDSAPRRKTDIDKNTSHSNILWARARGRFLFQPEYIGANAVAQMFASFPPPKHFAKTRSMSQRMAASRERAHGRVSKVSHDVLYGLDVTKNKRTEFHPFHFEDVKSEKCERTFNVIPSLCRRSNTFKQTPTRTARHTVDRFNHCWQPISEHSPATSFQNRATKNSCS